jgi:C1A family cysteine protease
MYQKLAILSLLLFGSLVFLTAAPISSADPPSSYDLRDYGLVTGVRDQGPYGTCWTHGAMASMEGSLLITGNWSAAGETGEPNLSERHLDWWNGFNTFNNDDDPGGGGLTVHQGGDYMVSSAYLSRGEGAVREIDAPYTDIGIAPDRTNVDYHYYYARDIEWYVAGEDLSNINLIKERLMSNGVIGTCLCSSSSFLDENYCHYQPPSSPYDPNHAVAIIGWDDNKVTQAPLPGAWLIKNSWGPYWGLGGYFWISYYDKWCGKHPEMGAVSLYNVEPFAYENVYYHDYHGWRDTKEDCSEAFNAFTADEDELLQAVSFFTAVDSVDYTVTIYDRFEGGQLLDQISSKSGFIELHGFHTIDLDTQVSLNAGNDFFIYLNLSDGGQPYDRTSDVPVLLGAQYRTIVESYARPGESYYKDGGNWIDLQDFDDPPWTGTANFCIKGFSVIRGLRVSPSGDMESQGPVGGPFSPSSQIYDMINKNNYPIEYQITHTTNWLTLSGDVSGVLPPLGTAQVTVEINSNAEELGEGEHHAMVYFTNLTDHAGDQTREVQLAVGEPAVQYEWTLDTDPGWTTTWSWAFGQPTGQGGSHGYPDPTSGYTGTNVYGYNLYGDYSNYMPETYLTSTAFDCSGLYNVNLKFWRWLGVESPNFDHAAVRISTDGSEWTTVWENEEEIEDPDWVEMDIDIRYIADDQPTVYVRWVMGPTDAGGTWCGWNIDDIRITAYEAGALCGDCNGDGEVGPGDVVHLLNYLYRGGPPPACSPMTICGDVNSDGDVGPGDVVYLLNYLYRSGPPPGNP